MFNQVKCCNERMSVKALLLVALLNKCDEDLFRKEKHILYFLLFQDGSGKTEAVSLSLLSIVTFTMNIAIVTKCQEKVIHLGCN